MQRVRPRLQVLLTGASVLALHAVLCWLLLIRTRDVLVAAGSRSIEIMLIAPTAKAPLRDPITRAAGARAPPNRDSSRSAPALDRTPPEPAQDSAPGARVDWEAELARAAAEAAAAATRPKPKDFGYPQAKTAPATPPEFGWDYASTHRVQVAPGGGLLVNLSDNCVLVFVPLPFVGCGLGHKPANGELFRHMSRSPPR